MAFEWVKPPGYGLDRGGWVSCTLPPDAPLDMILGWIEESYRVVAPKKLVAVLDEEDHTSTGNRIRHECVQNRAAQHRSTAHLQGGRSMRRPWLSLAAAAAALLAPLPRHSPAAG